MIWTDTNAILQPHLVILKNYDGSQNESNKKFGFANQLLLELSDFPSMIAENKSDCKSKTVFLCYINAFDYDSLSLKYSFYLKR